MAEPARPSVASPQPGGPIGRGWASTSPVPLVNVYFAQVSVVQARFSGAPFRGDTRAVTWKLELPAVGAGEEGAPLVGGELQHRIASVLCVPRRDSVVDENNLDTAIRPAPWTLLPDGSRQVHNHLPFYDHARRPKRHQRSRQRRLPRSNLGHPSLRSLASSGRGQRLRQLPSVEARLGSFAVRGVTLRRCPSTRSRCSRGLSTRPLRPRRPGRWSAGWCGGPLRQPARQRGPIHCTTGQR